MRNRAILLIPLGCMLASGCAIAPRWPGVITAWMADDKAETASPHRSLCDAWEGDQLADDFDLEPYAGRMGEAELPLGEPTVVEDQGAEDDTAQQAGVVTESTDASYLDLIDRPYAQASQYLEPSDPNTPAEAEPILTPPVAERSPFRYGDGEDDLDRFNRRLQDVPLDVRPTEGTMPTPPAIAEHPEQPRWVDICDGEGQPMTVVSCTPWTFCFRPLYFEEINLERYGCTAGILQPGISGAHFFGSIALMPYKMVVWPPRSCVCSNGFSRCTDCRPPGYRECVWSWKAAAVEAGIVAGIVLALP